MERLERAGVVREIGSRRRDRVFEAPDLFELVNGFERRLATPAGERRSVRRVPAR
jgi:hypothetical protein